MSWIVAGAFFIFILWWMRRAKDKSAELVASGEARSPLYWTGIALVASLLAISLYMVQLRSSGIPTILWLVVFALVVATLLVRRALKWRYPH